jgi:hypothetical protein
MVLDLPHDRPITAEPRAWHLCSRAFKREFGVPPGRVSRKDGTNHIVTL